MGRVRHKLWCFPILTLLLLLLILTPPGWAQGSKKGNSKKPAAQEDSPSNQDRSSVLTDEKITITKTGYVEDSQSQGSRDDIMKKLDDDDETAVYVIKKYKLAKEEETLPSSSGNSNKRNSKNSNKSFKNIKGNSNGGSVQEQEDESESKSSNGAKKGRGVGPAGKAPGSAGASGPPNKPAGKAAGDANAAKGKAPSAAGKGAANKNTDGDAQKGKAATNGVNGKGVPAADGGDKPGPAKGKGVSTNGQGDKKPGVLNGRGVDLNGSGATSTHPDGDDGSSKGKDNPKTSTHPDVNDGSSKGKDNPKTSTHPDVNDGSSKGKDNPKTSTHPDGNDGSSKGKDNPKTSTHPDGNDGGIKGGAIKGRGAAGGDNGADSGAIAGRTRNGEENWGEIPGKSPPDSNKAAQGSGTGSSNNQPTDGSKGGSPSSSNGSPDGGPNSKQSSGGNSNIAPGSQVPAKSSATESKNSAGSSSGSKNSNTGSATGSSDDGEDEDTGLTVQTKSHSEQKQSQSSGALASDQMNYNADGSVKSHRLGETQTVEQGNEQVERKETYIPVKPLSVEHLEDLAMSIEVKHKVVPALPTLPPMVPMKFPQIRPLALSFGARRGKRDGGSKLDVVEQAPRDTESFDRLHNDEHEFNFNRRIITSLASSAGNGGRSLGGGYLLSQLAIDDASPEQPEEKAKPATKPKKRSVRYARAISPDVFLRTNNLLRVKIPPPEHYRRRRRRRRAERLKQELTPDSPKQGLGKPNSAGSFLADRNNASGSGGAPNQTFEAAQLQRGGTICIIPLCRSDNTNDQTLNPQQELRTQRMFSRAGRRRSRKRPQTQFRFLGEDSAIKEEEAVTSGKSHERPHHEHHLPKMEHRPQNHFSRLIPSVPTGTMITNVKTLTAAHENPKTIEFVYFPKSGREPPVQAKTYSSLQRQRPRPRTDDSKDPLDSAPTKLVRERGDFRFKSRSKQPKQQDSKLKPSLESAANTYATPEMLKKRITQAEIDSIISLAEGNPSQRSLSGSWRSRSMASQSRQLLQPNKDTFPSKAYENNNYKHHGFNSYTPLFLAEHSGYSQRKAELTEAEDTFGPLYETGAAAGSNSRSLSGSQGIHQAAAVGTQEQELLDSAPAPIDPDRSPIDSKAMHHDDFAAERNQTKTNQTNLDYLPTIRNASPGNTIVSVGSSEEDSLGASTSQPNHSQSRTTGSPEVLLVGTNTADNTIKSEDSEASDNGTNDTYTRRRGEIKGRAAMSITKLASTNESGTQPEANASSSTATVTNNISDKDSKPSPNNTNEESTNLNGNCTAAPTTENSETAKTSSSQTADKASPLSKDGEATPGGNEQNGDRRPCNCPNDEHRNSGNGLKNSLKSGRAIILQNIDSTSKPTKVAEIVIHIHTHNKRPRKPSAGDSDASFDQLWQRYKYLNLKD